MPAAPRAALYARYSSEHQRDAFIEDQLRLCRERAEREGWSIVDSYSDRSISGASLIRPGIQALLQDAQAGRFNVVLTESLDRISRDQEDIAGVFKHLSFARVRMVTVSEGDISELHIGLKGTMGALFLKDLADKTRAFAAAWKPASRVAATAMAILSSAASARTALQSQVIGSSIRLNRPSSDASSRSTPGAPPPAPLRMR